MNIKKQTKKQLLLEIQRLEELLVQKQEGNNSGFYENHGPAKGPPNQNVISASPTQRGVDHGLDEKAPGLTRLSVDIASEALFWMKPDGSIVDVNQAACHMLGYSREEMLSMAVQDFDPHYRDKIWMDHFRELRQEGSLKFETLQRAKNGSMIPVEIVANYILFGGEEYNCAFVRDITERRAAQEMLNENEEKYRYMFDNNPQPMMIFNTADLAFLEVNKAAIRHYGYTRDEFLAMTLKDIRPQEDVAALTAHMGLITNESTTTGQWRHLKKDGQIIHVEIVSHTIIYKNYNARHVMVNDITQRHQAAQLLRESEEKHRFLIQQMHEGLMVVDNDDRIILVNPMYCKMMGYTQDELLGRIAHKLLLPPSQWSMIIRKNRDREKGISGIYELEMIKKSGEQISMLMNASPVYGRDGQVTGSMSTCIEITQRRQAEEAMRQMEISRQSARFKQNFLANMSHEIRTPLTGVLGMIEIMEQTVLSADQQDFINTMKVSGENLRQIINQVLDYSKIEAGKVSLRPSVFEFQSLLNDTRMLYQNSTRNKVQLDFHSDRALPAFICADRSRISQVLNNLVSNALKFTHKGKVVVRSKWMQQWEESNRLLIKMEVTDTGIGIPMHLQEKLFTPFSQVDNKDTRFFDGTGLGLSISKELAALLGGNIGFENNDKQGSTFWFTFLAEIPGPAFLQKPLPLKPQASNQGKLRILFAEDKLVNQKVVSLLLTAMGHEVTLAGNGKQAIGLFAPGKYDLILMDIQMPLMDGITATCRLKAKYKKMPPIVGLSANAFEGDREKYMDLGMDEYLTKPVNKEDFTRLFDTLFGKVAASSQRGETT